MAAPQFRGPDGVLRQQFVFSTTVPTRFFEGEMDPDTVDMQVSIRGAPFTSDPDFITFEGSSFTVPNPSALPDGLQLLPGDNDIRVKSILSTGVVSQEGVVLATLSLEANIDADIEAPTGLFLERFDQTVRITVEGLENENVSGFHFYASPQPGGGDIGYFRINPALIISGEVVEVEGELATLTVDAPIVLNSEGFHAADPLFFRVVGSQEDQFDDVLNTDFDEKLEVPESTEKLRIETSIKTVRQTRQFSFVHDRQATLSDPTNPAFPHSALSVVPVSDPLYYVVTAQHVVNGEEFESFFSPEVIGAPLVITPNIGTFPQTSRQQIVRSTVQSIFRSQPQVRVDPGSALRDTVIDPFSTEADRIRFMIGFLHNAQSFPTLLLIDDPGLSGESLPVNQSAYKIALREAFFLTSDEDVQTLIDNAFDKLASNYGVVREGGKRARAEVTFFVTDRPTTPITRNIGTVLNAGGVGFRTTSSAIISTTGGGRVFSPTTGRFFDRAFVQADAPGSDGNVAAGQITVIENNTLLVQVVNESPAFGGTDRESNRTLATRAIGVLSSVDSGTFQGYVENSVNVPGVEQVNVIQAGNALMMRDRNPDNGRHVGGKVDIWLRGISEAKVTDAFAFSFETRRAFQFEPVGDLTALKFRAVDPALSVDNPIIEMLDIEVFDLVFENVTRGTVFDLTDVQIVSFNSIQLSSDNNDPAAHSFGDEFRGAYRFRTSNKFVLPRQPVIEVTRFEGTQTGLVPEGIFSLFRASDPLELGRSTEAGDFVQVIEPLDDEGTTIPSSTPIEVTDEDHTILDGIEFLNNLGINSFTVRVFNLERTIEYNGPLSNGIRDFTFIDGTETVPLGIQLTDGSQIAEGETVLVDYFHDENFEVEYTTNAVVSAVQSTIDGDSHITADAIAKSAVEVPVDIQATVVLRRNETANVVDDRIRTALSRLFGTFSLATPVRPSDVIRAIDATQGVDYVVTPLTKMVKGDGAIVVREALPTDQVSDAVLIEAWTSPTVRVFLLLASLDASTINGGGPVNEFRGVFEDEVGLIHHEVPPNFNGFPLRGSPGGEFIIGAEGLNIPGYSDNATIEADNVLPTNEDEKAAEILRIRKLLTANRVLVSYAAGGDEPDNPVPHDYTVTYIVDGDAGVKNIEPGPIEYLVTGDFDFVKDEPSRRLGT